MPVDPGDAGVGVRIIRREAEVIGSRTRRGEPFPLSTRLRATSSKLALPRFPLSSTRQGRLRFCCRILIISFIYYKPVSVSKGALAQVRTCCWLPVCSPTDSAGKFQHCPLLSGRSSSFPPPGSPPEGQKTGYGDAASRTPGWT